MRSAGFDGFVAKFTGDGVLVYFGYPQAHEDDVERAVPAWLGSAAAGAARPIASTARHGSRASFETRPCARFSE